MFEKLLETPELRTKCLTVFWFINIKAIELDFYPLCLDEIK